MLECMPWTKIQINLSPNTYKLTWSSDTVCYCPLLALTAMSNLRPPCHKVSHSTGVQPTVYAKRPVTNGSTVPRFVMFFLSSYVALKIICAICLLCIATCRGNIQKPSHPWRQNSIIPQWTSVDWGLYKPTPTIHVWRWVYCKLVHMYFWK